MKIKNSVSTKDAVLFLDSKRYDDEELSLTRTDDRWSRYALTSLNDDFVWLVFDKSLSKWTVVTRNFYSKTRFEYDSKNEAVDAVVAFLKDFEE
jgi:hypothetical protein